MQLALRPEFLHFRPGGFGNLDAQRKLRRIRELHPIPDTRIASA